MGIGRAFKKGLAVLRLADDESANCGGTISGCSAEGVTSTIILLTRGERGNPEGVNDATLKAVRTAEAERVARILGVSRLIQQDFGDGMLRQHREEVTAYLAPTIR